MAPHPAAALGQSELARAIAAVGGRPKAPLLMDESLGRAATRHGEAIGTHKGQVEPAQLRADVAREGLADAQLLPFAGIGDLDALAEELRTFTELRVRGHGMTHFGLSVRRGASEAVLVAIFARRLVELAPLPARVDREGFRIRGMLNRAALHARAFLTLPDGNVRPLEVARNGEEMAVDVPFTEGKGTYTFELVAEAGYGPEILALWRFGHHEAREPEPIMPPTADAPTLGRAWQLLNETRSKHARSLLHVDERLARAAEQHAKDVCKTMMAAHVLPGGKSPRERAQVAGWRGEVAENIAIAASLSRAYDNLLASPSHRQNLLEPGTTVAGLGVGLSDGSVCLVQLFSPGSSPKVHR